MKDYSDREIKFTLRGDDIERLNEAIALSEDNIKLASYLCYLKTTIIEQLRDINFPKEEYPIGSLKGYTWEEAIKIISNDEMEE